MNDDELSTLLAKFLLYMMDNGVAVKYEGNLSELRDEFIAQLDKKDGECKKLDAARRVHKSLAGDGYYGPYVLGDDLWGEFDELFTIGDKEGY